MAITTGMAIAAGVSAASSLAGGAMAKAHLKKHPSTRGSKHRTLTLHRSVCSKSKWNYKSHSVRVGLPRKTRSCSCWVSAATRTPQGYGSMAKAFGTEQFQQDPGYAFRQAEGMKALERSAAARGNLLSGSTLKGVQRFGQDLASQEYQNAFNRYQVERAARLNPLQSLMGSGQSAANVMTGAAGQMGQNEASNLYNAGQARASGYIGQANALTNALGQIGSIASYLPEQNAMINYYNRTPAGGLGGSGTPVKPRGAKSPFVAF
jgi:hypothetical protein